MKVIKELIPYVVIILVVVIIRSYIVTPVRVDGTSMYPTLKDGEILLLEKYNHKYNRGDIVVVNYGNEKIIKRIIALPGETVEYKDDVLYISGKPYDDYVTGITGNFPIVKLTMNEYFVMGDNRKVSNDSRMIGPIKTEDINGTTRIRVFPLDKIGKIKL